MLVQKIKTVLWMLSITYYSIWSLPFLAFYQKEDIYMSFCYFNYIVATILGTRIYWNKNLKKEKSLLIMNHQSIFDTMIAFLIQSHESRIYESCLKKSISLLPGVGWWCRIMNFPILSRNKKDLEKLTNHETKNSILIYPEGTRKTKKKYEEAIAFSKKESLPLSDHTLIPKSKGAMALLKNNTIEHVSFSFVFYHTKENKFLNDFGNWDFPEKVYIHNKSFSKGELDLTEFKSFLQNEFLKCNDILPHCQKDTFLLGINRDIETRYLTNIIMTSPILFFSIIRLFIMSDCAV